MNKIEREQVAIVILDEGFLVERIKSDREYLKERDSYAATTQQQAVHILVELLNGICDEAKPVPTAEAAG